jgi:glutamyl-tRNA synthetase
MINFLARLGWAHGDDEIFSREQLVEWFDIVHVHPSPARFDVDKLHWVNHEHIKRLSDEALGERLRAFLERAGLDVSQGPPTSSVAALLRDRAPTLLRMAQEAEYFYGETPGAGEVRQARAAKVKSDLALVSALQDLGATFQSIDWNREAIGNAIKATAAKYQLKPPQIMMPVRELVTGTAQTPAIDAVLALLGRERTIERLARALT